MSYKSTRSQKEGDARDKKINPILEQTYAEWMTRLHDAVMRATPTSEELSKVKGFKNFHECLHLLSSDVHRIVTLKLREHNA